MISLAIAITALFVYQSGASARAEVLAENDAAVAEVEKFNRQILEDEEELERQIEAIKKESEGITDEEEEEEESWYIDGTYEGEGTGFGGAITVSVTIESDKVTAIEALTHADEDPAYFESALAVLDSILKAQSLDVDTISGATFSSTGLIDAVGDALVKGERG